MAVFANKKKSGPNNRFQGALHKVSGPLNRDVGRTILSNTTWRYSIFEILGILLMLIGVGLGFYSTILSAKAVAHSKPAADSFSNPDASMLELRDSYIRMMEPTYASLNKITLSRGGAFVFLSGLFVFTVARRRRWNACLCRENSPAQDHAHPSPRA